MQRIDRGAALDYIGISFHSQICTHLDALCHVWDDDGMWGGRDPDKYVQFDGVKFADVDKWGDGIVTRGVLLDVVSYRGTSFVTSDEPVHGSELRAIARAQEVSIEPGDAIVVYCGRENWDRANPIWGSEPERPGLHASCLRFLRETDTAVLVWDMQDHLPFQMDVRWAVHAAIWAFGVAIVDNAVLEPLAEICHEEGRFEFQLCMAPLRVPGGTGGPINPIALF
jgi:kynurenine formamidase